MDRTLFNLRKKGQKFPLKHVFILFFSFHKNINIQKIKPKKKKSNKIVFIMTPQNTYLSVILEVPHSAEM